MNTQTDKLSPELFRDLAKKIPEIRSHSQNIGTGMARRNRSSALDDIIHLVSMLPWWLGLSLGLISYLWLHHVASQSIATPPPGIHHMSDVVTSQLWHTFAFFLQYIIPFACILGAGVSAFQGSSKNKPHKENPISQARKIYAHKNDSADINVAEPRQAQAAPDCPQCGILMVKRYAKNGSRSGDGFWGCSSYPKCKGTRKLNT